jgi:hypothetical protein
MPEPYTVWNDQKYSDGTPVPLRREKCKSHKPSAAFHTCKLHESHTGEHRCICNQRWPRS